MNSTLCNLCVMLVATIASSLTWSEPSQQVAAFPVFQDLDPGLLKVRVKAIGDSLSGYDSAFITLTVSNPTEFWAEPVEFYVPIKKDKRRKGIHAPRVAPPFARRAGRAIAPHGKQTYLIGVPVSPKHLGKSKLRVTAASFFAGEAQEEVPIEIGALGEAEPDAGFNGQSTPFATVLLSNLSDIQVDAILLVEFESPRSGKAFVRFRLSPKEQRTCTIEGPEISFFGSPDLLGSKVKSVELVDWSALIPDPSHEAERLLRSAYGARARWAGPPLTVEARYAIEVEEGKPASSGRQTSTASGVCSWPVAGLPWFEPDPGQKSLGWESSVLSRATQWFTTRSFEQWIDGASIRVHSRDESGVVVGVLGSKDQLSMDRYLWIKDGEIVAKAASPLSGNRTEFNLRGHRIGSVLAQQTEVYMAQGEIGLPTTYSFEYGEIDGIPIPLSAHMLAQFNPEQQNRIVDIKLTQVSIKERPEAKLAERAPSGPVADELRLAWEQGARLPDKPVTLAGHFRMVNSGNDQVWLGHRVVEGDFVLTGFTHASWDAASIVLTGSFTEVTNTALVGIVLDRFRMFMSRDMTGRLSFDQQFAGAQVSKKGSKFVVEGNGFSQVTVKRGLIQTYSRGGEKTRLTWKRIGETDVLSQSERSRETMKYHHEQVDGVWVVTKVTMEDVFEDWGPETVELTKLLVTPEL